MFYIVCGSIIIIILIVIGTKGMVKDLGWRGALKVWITALVAAALISFAATLIAYGITHV